MDQLKKYREQIDQLDAQIIRLISRRINVVKKIIRIKQNLKLPRRDRKRWQTQLDSMAKRAQALRLDPELIKKIYEEIHKFVLNIKDKPDAN